MKVCLYTNNTSKVTVLKSWIIVTLEQGRSRYGFRDWGGFKVVKNFGGAAKPPAKIFFIARGILGHAPLKILEIYIF